MGRVWVRESRNRTAGYTINCIGWRRRGFPYLPKNLDTEDLGGWIISKVS